MTGDVVGWQETVDLVKTRGHWRLLVRPLTYRADRVQRTDALALIRGTKVSLRGWDFPHVDNHVLPTITAAWVGQAYQWEHAIEHWRQYCSGQFVSICGIPYEWRDRSNWWPPSKDWQENKVLGVVEAIFRLTEFSEFSARLATSDAGDSEMFLSATAGRMAGRWLIVDSPTRAGLWGEYRASSNEIEIVREVRRDDLVSDSPAVARSLALELFSYFNWAPEPELIKGIQDELLARR